MLSYLVKEHEVTIVHCCRDSAFGKKLCYDFYRPKSDYNFLLNQLSC